MTSRARIAIACLVVDLVAVLVACLIAYLLRFEVLFDHGVRVGPGLDWSVLVVIVAALVAFASLGLYKGEVFVSRPLHVWTLVKGCGYAFLFTALVVYLLKSPSVQESRFIVVTTFVFVFVMGALGRLGVLSPLVHRELRRRRRRTLVIGRSGETELLTRRLSDLKGYNSWRHVDPGLEVDGFEQAFAAVEDLEPTLDVPPNVFVEASSLPPQVVLELVAASKLRGADVYVVSRLLGPLDSTGLLVDLFGQPVMRVRTPPGGRGVPFAKRMFDILASAVAMIFMSPVLLVIAVAVKRSSPGPVLYTQTRVGLRGRPFRFYKFRSMREGDDDLHKEYVCAYINGDDTSDLVECEELTPFKIASHPRTTRVGAILRKYSLDELPQFWNVLVGDMSLVGPRPALPYEVELYQEWHRRRLSSVPGVSGLWQVTGRSRVGFDEMVLEDVLYASNQSLLTDIGICLRTIPVVLLGRGGA